jgi:hypothetical protein
MSAFLLAQVAIMSEIGWHIQQDWYYREEYNILNMGFYFFLCSGLSAWAFGLHLNQGGAAAAAAAVAATAADALAPAVLHKPRQAGTLNLGQR